MSITSKPINSNNFLIWNKVSGVYSESLLTTIQLPPAFASSAYDISEMVAEKSFAFGESMQSGLYIRSDGLKMYALAFTNDLVKEYDFGTAFDVSTLSFNQSYAPTEDTNWNGLTFSPDGDKLYLCGRDNDTIFEYDLSTAWDLSTASYSSNFFDVNSEQALPSDIYIREDGEKMFLIGTSPDAVTEYDFGTPFDVSTLSEAQTVAFSQDRSIHFDNSGTRMFLGQDGFTDSLAYYDLTTPWDISTAVLNDSITIEASGIFVSADGFTVYTKSSSVLTQSQIPDNSLPPKYGNEDQYDSIIPHAIKFYQSDTLSFYANLDTLEDNANFANWRLDVVDADFNTIYYDVATLSQDIISGSDYRFYVDGFTIPSTWESNCYRFVIIDETNTTIKYISNIFEYSNKIAPYTHRIRYRNSVNILNFNYEGLSNFKNEFRIKLVKRAPNYQTSRIGYELVSGAFNPVRTTQGINYEFVTEDYGQNDLEAWNSATIQNLEIYNESKNEWEAFKRNDGSNLEVEWFNNYPTTDGSIRLEQVNTFRSSKNV